MLLALFVFSAVNLEHCANDARMPELLAFDQKLRAAQTPEDFVPLLRFPLRIYRDERTLRIADAAAFLADASRILTKALVAALRTDADPICRYEQLGYVGGHVWVGHDGARFSVESIYVGTLDPKNLPSPTNPEVDVLCRTKTQAYAVERIGENKWRLRVGRGKEAKLIGARSAYTEGTGPCTHWIWRFAGIEVSERGCTDGSEPADSVAEVTTRAGSEWCVAP
jgi:hypothetical protein